MWKSVPEGPIRTKRVPPSTLKRCDSCRVDRKICVSSLECLGLRHFQTHGETWEGSHIVIACSERPDFCDVRYTFGKRQGLKVGTIPYDVQRTCISATGAGDDLFLAKNQLTRPCNITLKTCLSTVISVHQRSVQYWANVLPCIQDLQKTPFIEYNQAPALSKFRLV